MTVVPSFFGCVIETGFQDEDRETEGVGNGGALVTAASRARFATSADTRVAMLRFGLTVRQKPWHSTPSWVGSVPHVKDWQDSNLQGIGPSTSVENTSGFIDQLVWRGSQASIFDHKAPHSSSEYAGRL